MSTAYRGRLAPSPTGRLHLGVARTSLVAFLCARAGCGKLVLRIEDIDTPRVVAGAATAIMQELRWLGLHWDEGPDVGGPHAPYFQSQRLPLYAQAIERLRTQGLIYPCTCSRKEIAGIASAPHGELGPLYPGTCRNGCSHPQRPQALRLRMPQPAPSFVDHLHGLYDQGAADDFVLQRADGVYAYQLAVVVDDIAMGISHVVRGDDLMSSTPRQLALYHALGAPPPEFLHVPLLLDSQGQRLSKRQGSMSLTHCRRMGARPEQVVGLLAHSLGLIERYEPIAALELLQGFNVKRLAGKPVALDEQHLPWLAPTHGA